MSMSTTITVPQEYQVLVDTVAERWGYYLAKRSIQSELMRKTKVERAKVRSLGSDIADRINDWVNNGTDTRKEIRALQGELAQAKQVLKVKSAPFYDRMRPLTKAISYLDKDIIPNQIEQATGEKLTPRFKVSTEIVRALAKPKKK